MGAPQNDRQNRREHWWLPLALEGRVNVTGKRVGIILSGGNVDLSQVSAWIAQL